MIRPWLHVCTYLLFSTMIAAQSNVFISAKWAFHAISSNRFSKKMEWLIMAVVVSIVITRSNVGFDQHHFLIAKIMDIIVCKNMLYVKVWIIIRIIINSKRAYGNVWNYFCTWMLHKNSLYSILSSKEYNRLVIDLIEKYKRIISITYTSFNLCTWFKH